VSPQLVFLIGPAAVGKMTVGLELQRRTGFRLLHNHMTIDLVLPFFDFGTDEFNRLVTSFRSQIVEAVADSDLPGLVFTFVWAFDEPSDAVLIERYAEAFRTRGLPVWFVELQASQEERLERNRTELRLQHKPLKRDLAWSDANLLDLDERYQLAAPAELRNRPDWLYVDTTELSPQQTAELIISHFDLPEAIT
jgi:hypothetical protein